MPYSYEQKRAIFDKLAGISPKEKRDLVMDLATFIFDGNKSLMTVFDNFINEHTTNEINDIKYQFLDGWFTGVNEGEIDHWNLKSDQQQRLESLRDKFYDALVVSKKVTQIEEKSSSAAPAEEERVSSTWKRASVSKERTKEPPPLPPRSAHLLQAKSGQSQSKTRTSSSEQELDIAEKNKTILGLIQDRLTKVKKDWVKDQKHEDRKFALTELISHIKLNYADNKEVIDLTQVEQQIIEGFGSDEAKKTQFRSGASDEPGKSKLKAKSEYAKMKEQAAEIKDKSLVQVRKKKSHGQ